MDRGLLHLVFCLFPFYWLINVSLKTGSDLSQSDLFPPNPTLDNYSSIFKNDNFTSALKNSVIVTTVTTILALIVGSFAAYALARLRFKHKFLILALILSISTFPAIAIAAPMFKLWTDIGLYDTRIGLIIPYLTFALPLAIYILTSFFKEIPKELEEAALVDGATLLPGVPQGRASACRSRPRHGRSAHRILRVERVPARGHAHQLAGRVHRARVRGELHRQPEVRGAARDDQRGVRGDHGPARARGDHLPEADRGRHDGRRRQGLTGH